jgi:dTDP-4-dehydrorhamnose 3,5-epimerase
LFIPHGFAHGFSVLSEKAVVIYKTDDYYKKDAERGIAYNDPFLNIDWRINPGSVQVSDRDRQLPVIEKAEFNFIL